MAFLYAVASGVVYAEYLVDDFEDVNLWNNAHGYWHRYDPGVVDEVADPADPSNDVLRIRMSAGWYATNTWNGSNPATLLDAAEYTHLSIKVRGAAGSEDFKVELQDHSDHKQSFFISSFMEGPITSDWQEVNIPLGAYSVIDFQQTEAIAFIFYTSGTIFVDDIRFITSDTEPMVRFGGSEFYFVDDFEDADPWHNLHGYWHRYDSDPGGFFEQINDPEDPANKVLRINMSADWFASNTWDGSDPTTLLNARYFTHLAIMVKGASGEENFNVELQDSEGNIVEIPIGYPVADTWQDLAVPLSEFEGIDFERIVSVALKFQGSGTIYIDDIRFVGCVIDDFEDARINYNRLNKWVGWGGHSINCVDTADGAHMITWTHIPVLDPNYWYTVVEFNEPDASCDSKYYNRVYFRIKGASGGEDFTVKYEEASDAAYVTVSDYVTITTEWQEVTIPIKDFTDQGVRREGMKALAFVFCQEGTHTIYVDDIELRYDTNPPYLTDKTTFYKGMPRGIHIGFDPDGDPLIYQASNLPAGVTFDEETGYLTWKPDTPGTYRVYFSVQEDRKDAPVVEGDVDLVVEDFMDPKPESVGPIRLDKATRQLYVNGRPFKIKGVGYQPVPIGQDVDPEDPTNTWFENTDIFERDFPLLKQIGVNTIRLWGWPYDVDGREPFFLRDINPILNAAANYDIKVCLGFWVDDSLDPEDPIDRAVIKRNFSKFVDKLKDYDEYPAILMWVIGNEDNYEVLHNKPQWYSLVNELARLAYNIETAHNGENNYHPVAVVNGDLYNMMNADMNADDASLAYIDIWGSNMYPGYTFVDKLNAFAELSNKPLWVSEYGIDAYHTIAYEWDDVGRFFYATDGYVDEATHADWVANNTIEIQASSVTCGSTVMAYSDEWWKSRGDTSTHETNGFPWPPENGVTRQPDDFSNEQYWGIMKITKHPIDGHVDIVFPRQLYYRLEEIFAEDTEVIPGESIQDVIDDPSSTPVIRVPEGVYSQDSIINVRNNKTLLGSGDVRNILVKGRILFAESDGEINNMSILFPTSEETTFANDSYPGGITIGNDAGVTIINSNAVVKNCIIQPDLDGINAGGEYNPPLTQYGKGIQIWNLYNAPNIALDISNNLVLNSDIGIYLFTQAFGGAIEGVVEYTTLENNRYGLIMRMHKENPILRYNIITNAQDGIHITYEDGTLLHSRLQNITDNNFWNNVSNVWCDALQSEQSELPDAAGNISVDPLYNGDYEAEEVQCSDKGWRLPE